MAKICVFCSSSGENLSKIYVDAARRTGQLLGEKKHHLVYGGSHRGLMGEVSKAFAEYSKEVTEVIPQFWEPIAIKNGNIIVTKDIGERLRRMQEISDAFISLAGGFGTWHENLDVLVAKQIGLSQKPLVIVNTNKFYNPFITQVKKMVDQRFASKDNYRLLHITSTPEKALNYIENYSPPKTRIMIKV